MTYADGVTCDLANVDASPYSVFQGLASQMKDRKSCYAVIDDLFKMEDLNGDGFVERCEDAKAQVAIGGSTPEYATKFSAAYNLAAFR